MNISIIKLEKYKKEYKILLIVILLGICCVLTYYFHAILKTGKIFTYFFYIPIILSCIWWNRKGLLVATFLAVLLILSHIFIRVGPIIADDYIRVLMFIVIGSIIASISERISRSTEKIKSERSFSDNVIAAVPDPLLVLDKDLMVKEANISFCKLFRIESEKVIGNHIANILGDKGKELIPELSKLFRTEDIMNDFELHYYSENLGERIFDIRAKRLVSADELLLVMEDITKHNKVDEKLRIFAKFMNSSIDGIAIGGHNGRITYVNKEFIKMFGYSEEELIGKEITFIYPESEIPKLKKALNETMEGGWRGVLIGKRKDGKLFPMDISSSRIAEGEDKISVIIATHRDISEHVENVKQIQLQRKWLESFVQYSPLGIVKIDNNNKVISCNSVFEKIFQYRESEIVGKGIDELIAGKEFIKEAQAITRKSTIDGMSSKVITKQRRKDGTWVDVEVFAVPIKIGDKLYGQFGMYYDITNRKKAEEELRGSRKQLRKLAAHLQSVREEERTWIAREIHDELGQTMTALKMNLSWLNNKITKKQKILKEKTKTMLNLIDGTIQNVQRISTELRPGILDDFGLPSAIEWYTEEFQKRTGIQCKVTINPEDIILAKDLSMSIFRIFQETLTNVARHAKATNVRASLRVKDNMLELKVRDNGIGIKKEQISNYNSLGLISMRERVYPWGGDFKIKGIRNKGTTVTLTIPLQK
ncbi:PAS domain S-box protein [candidate division WOR-3 bacterium]|nr:PAS domain S-box protein [candidate division WOR-3 bacterium]